MPKPIIPYLPKDLYKTFYTIVSKSDFKHFLLPKENETVCYVPRNYCRVVGETPEVVLNNYTITFRPHIRWYQMNEIEKQIHIIKSKITDIERYSKHIIGFKLTDEEIKDNLCPMIINEVIEPEKIIKMLQKQMLLL